MQSGLLRLLLFLFPQFNAQLEVLERAEEKEYALRRRGQAKAEAIEAAVASVPRGPRHAAAADAAAEDALAALEAEDDEQEQGGGAFQGQGQGQGQGRVPGALYQAGETAGCDDGAAAATVEERESEEEAMKEALNCLSLQIIKHFVSRVRGPPNRPTPDPRGLRQTVTDFLTVHA